MANLRDVAERAGVSVATASRVASGSASVRPETRERVERAMRQLLYVPPAAETSSGAIGLLLPEFENPVFAAFAQAMEEHASKAGFATILCNTAGEPLREVDYVHMLLERRVDGMIFISAEITDVRGAHSHYRQLLERGARLVFVNGGAESLDALARLGTDGSRAARDTRGGRDTNSGAVCDVSKTCHPYILMEVRLTARCQIPGRGASGSSA